MTLIKWPGGKKREIPEFKAIIPTDYARYIEPFFGGGAVFFYLQPQQAIINDISTNLIDFYRMVKVQNQELKTYLEQYATTFKKIKESGQKNHAFLYTAFQEENILTETEVEALLLPEVITSLIPNKQVFIKMLTASVNDKLQRTRRNHEKLPMSEEDLFLNFVTGLTSGYYLYFRKVYNDIQLDRADFKYSAAYRVANFYWIREYCYGSMFRYNASGEFNIPYGGISYNRKNFNEKINKIFSLETQELFKNTAIENQDFQQLMTSLTLTQEDFIFLDPPYDTEFSDYEGRSFGKEDQTRLRDFLAKTPAKALLVIKNTDFIFNLYYEPQDQNGNPIFHLANFDKQYTYNVRARNERNVDHLIITNYPIEWE